MTVEQVETDTLVRAEGELTISSAEAFKRSLMDGLARGSALHLDLTQAEFIDLTVMQLLWAVEREAQRAGTRVVIDLRDEAEHSMASAGLTGSRGTEARR